MCLRLDNLKPTIRSLINKVSSNRTHIVLGGWGLGVASISFVKLFRGL